ncbi:ferritin-like domain-containing protein [Sorangium sp. So ce1099]|uniref:ferritin-like domain-containing protein n=1 Tax=Sorangium sp. So ce1099 TaxID=3133331 RepID=UPI003F628C39
MNTAHAFRLALAHRLFTLLALSAAGASAGCHSASSCDEDPEPVRRVACFAWPQDDAGAPGGSGGTGGSAGSAGGAGGSGGGGEPLACPSRSEGQEILNQSHFASHSVRSEGTFEDGQCCYQAYVIDMCLGRPYVVDEAARTAPSVRARRDAGWGAAESMTPRTDHLAADLREKLAAAWARDALLEHASVASFGRFALELLAAGAPAGLVEEAHRAALDEARHARLCFALASAYAGEAIAPGAFPFDGRVDVSADLASIAARAATEGCIGETIAAVVAAEELGAAEDPAVRSALAIIAADEARHAELAWRTVAWAIRAGGERVRAAVAEVFAGLGCAAVGASGGVDSAGLAAHGRSGAAARAEAAARAIEEVVRPAARLLLARGEGAAPRALVV